MNIMNYRGIETVSNELKLVCVLRRRQIKEIHYCLKFKKSGYFIKYGNCFIFHGGHGYSIHKLEYTELNDKSR